ncbi:MAG TPA: porphobilinogen synthase [Actinomycetota bacterium]|nr:porphobilinogen synthase [Actinomycetota bacterium]
MYPVQRPRRLRRTESLRAMVRETRLAPEQLVAPLFVKEGIREPEPVASMPGHYQHTVESLTKTAREIYSKGVRAYLLFAIPSRKDGAGSEAHAQGGIAQRALAALRDEIGADATCIADLCLCEYTDHGHCGILRPDGSVDNDATVEAYAMTAVAQARAGAAVVAPSGMMDGQVGAIRRALDSAGHAEVAVMAYSAKYASALYGPFRDAAECAPRSGDRSGYQMDPSNVREALREVALDVAEGADIVMVKPALSYLDVVRAVSEASPVPVAAYHVSGEYSMVKAAGAAGWLDADSVAIEHLTSIRRAGADIVITYFAQDLADRL